MRAKGGTAPFNSDMMFTLGIGVSPVLANSESSGMGW
jgi:hypothetical protein